MSTNLVTLLQLDTNLSHLKFLGIHYITKYIHWSSPAYCTIIRDGIAIRPDMQYVPSTTPTIYCDSRLSDPRLERCLLDTQINYLDKQQSLQISNEI
jgi:hypothetical protein